MPRSSVASGLPNKMELGDLATVIQTKENAI